ncbi:MAG TPA: cupin domain-containing protein [Thermoleophilaceae bacterium]|nr:cupin domain-containing protein [Thermoleophilaceae bacterium]
MPGPYTVAKLTEVEDSAPKFGMSELQEARFANDDLEVERTGVSFLRVHAGKRQGFGHKHDHAEEVYVVLSGNGRLKLDGEILEVEPLDAIRVAPGVTRQFEAGAEQLEVLAFGPRHKGDGEIVQDWWTD